MKNWRAIEFRLEQIETLITVINKAKPSEMKIYISILIEYAEEIKQLIKE